MMLPSLRLPVRSISIAACVRKALPSVLAVVAFASWCGVGRAQLPGRLDPGFAPSARSKGSAAAVATQADGKLVVGGAFHRAGQTVSQSVARFNADGSIDAAFTPPADLADVVSVAIGPDGKIAVLQSNGLYPSETYTLLRLNPDGSRDTTFIPAVLSGFSSYSYDDNTFVLAVQSDGKVLVAGVLHINGDAILRYNANGSLDTSFQLNNQISAYKVKQLLILNNGQVLGSGNLIDYSSPTHQQGQRIFRLNADGSLDASYFPDTGDSGTVAGFALQPDGKVVYLARLVDPNGLTQANSDLAGGVPRRLNADGSADAGFAPQFGNGATFTAVKLQPDGKILVSGYTANYYATEAGGFTRAVFNSGIARLNADGSLDTTFHSADPLTDGSVEEIGLQANGQILVGGKFTTLGGLSRFGLGRINADGSADPGYASDLTQVGYAYAIATLPDGRPLLLDSADLVGGQPANLLVNLNLDGSLNTAYPLPGIHEDRLYRSTNYYSLVNSALAQQADGKILITTGLGFSYPYTPATDLLRVNPDGSVDTNFTAHFGSNYDPIYAALPQPDGRIFAVGNMGEQDVAIYPIALLNADGSFNPTFKSANIPGVGPYADASTFFALALQPDGRVLAGGTLVTFDGSPVPGIIRFNADGSVDPSFQSGVIGVTDPASSVPRIFVLATQTDGKVVAAGLFSSVGGAPRGNVTRFNADGSLDVGFNPGGAGADGVVRTLVLQADGKILLGGEFHTVNGLPREGIVRLNVDGTVDSQFDPGTGTEGSGIVTSLALEPDGSVLVAGNFSRFNGQERDGVARLFGGDIPAVPVITSEAISGRVGEAFAYQIAAAGTVKNFGAAGLPDGLSVDAATGLISGTPTVAGTFAIALSAGNLGGTGAGVLTLTVEPALPVITLQVTAPQVTVGSGGAAEVTVTRSGDDLSTKVVVAYQLKGSAANGVDYVRRNGKLKLKPGKTSAKIRIVPLGAGLGPGAKKVVKVTLLPGDAYMLGEVSHGKVKIAGQ